MFDVRVHGNLRLASNRKKNMAFQRAVRPYFVAETLERDRQALGGPANEGCVVR